MLAFVLSLGLAWTARAGQGTDTMEFLLNGSAPSPAVSLFLEQEMLSRQLLDVQSSAGGLASTPSCTRYHSLLTRAFDGLKDKLSQPVGGQRERLYARLLINAILSLNYLQKDKAEGGYGTLDGRPAPCDFSGRTEWSSKMNALAEQLARFAPQWLGAPGLRTLDQIEDELLRLAARRESAHNRREAQIFAGATLASLFFWAYAPAAAAGAAGVIWGTPPALMASPGFALAARSAALAAEGLGVHWIFLTLNPEEDLRARGALPSWEEQMHEIERLLNEDSPELQLYYTGLLRAQLARAFAPWVQEHLSTLKAEPEFRELTELLEEALQLESDSALEVRDERRQNLQREFGYHVSCAESLWDGVSKFNCILGLKTLTRALQRGELPSRPPQAAVLNIHLRAQRPFLLENGDLYVWAKAPRADLVAAVRVALLHPETGKNWHVLTSYESDLRKLAARVPMRLQFEENLSLPERWSAVMKLNALAEKEPALFQRSAEELRIGRLFAPLHEQGERLAETLKADAPVGEMAKFLRAQQEAQVGLSSEVRAQRDRAAELAADLSRRLNAKVECSGQVNSAECLIALFKLRLFLNDFHAENRPSRFVIVGRTESAQPVTATRAGTSAGEIWLRADFDLKDLIEFVRPQSGRLD